MKMTVAHVSLPAQGESVNGDRALYRSDENGHLVAVIDGLGHGPAADEASQAAVAYLASSDLASPLLDLMEGAHRAMNGTRGAAATVCVLRKGAIQICAVGNVEMRSGTLRVPLITSPGVLGTRVHKFRICQAPIERNARLILFSDGISSRVHFEQHTGLSPHELCQHVITEHRRDHDDATILVADLEPLL